MKKIGKIRTVNAIVPLVYEVISADERLYAGKDAFFYPDNKEDLRAYEALVPKEWEWIEQYEEISPYYGEPRKNAKDKYSIIQGEEALKNIETIIQKYDTGHLAMFDGGFPYVIPINHAYAEGKLYLHTGRRGKKLELLQKNPNVCYELDGIAGDNPKNLRSCHLEYESVVMTGRLRFLESEEEKMHAAKQLTEQYGTPLQHGHIKMCNFMELDIISATARVGRFKLAYEKKLYVYQFKGEDQV